MSGSWTRGLVPALIPWFEWIASYVRYYDPTAVVTSGYRSTSEQRRLYDRFLRGLMPGPVAPPGLSMHEQGRAIDIFTSSGKDTARIEDALQRAGAAWEAQGGTWGGHFKGSGKFDPIHFEA